MATDLPDGRVLVQSAGLALGIVIGGTLGPLVFKPIGISIPMAATAGSFFGAILGYLVAWGLVVVERRRRDGEIKRAAEAVRAEAGLPESIVFKVKDARMTMEGEVASYDQRHKTEQVISTLSGIKEVTNRIRLRVPAGGVTASPDEIRGQIRDRLVQRAELEVRGIRVVLINSRLVLEGTVSSWAEASEAEEAAWEIPGIAAVDNRLEIAA